VRPPGAGSLLAGEVHGAVQQEMPTALRDFSCALSTSLRTVAVVSNHGPSWTSFTDHRHADREAAGERSQGQASPAYGAAAREQCAHEEQDTGLWRG
jgi:hypothetical protein